MTPTIELKEYIERMLDEREKAQTATLNATLREATIHREEIERRLSSLNNLHDRVFTDRTLFVKKNELDLRNKVLLDKIETNINDISEMKQWQAKIAGYGGALIFIASLISTVLSVVISLLILIT